VDPDTLSRILSFQRELLRMSTAASAAFSVPSAALVVLAFVMAAAALVAFFMVMVVTVGTGVHKVASQIGLDCLVSVSGSACADFDSRILERVQSSAAQTAADQHLNVVPGKKSCQRSVPDPVGTDHFTRYDLSVLYLIYFKTLSSSEMLKDISVIISYRNLHICPF
jgi:hypothetical protein